MNNKLVSIPVFVYNGEKFLKQQIDSLINQTYKNIEIIICDDSSSDNSLDIIKQYSKIANLTYYTNEINIGITKNVEKGLSLCRGNYIASCDHDDIWLPNKIELLVQNIENNMLIYSKSTKIDKNNNALASSSDIIHLSGACNKSLIIQNCVSGHTLMFKKELLNHILPFPKNYIHPDWWIAYIASSVGKIKHIDISLVNYRQHDNQITKNKTKKRLEPFSKMLNKIKQFDKGIQSRVEMLKALYSYNQIDASTKILIENLITQTEFLNTSFKNKKLNNILLEHTNELLLTIPSNLREKIANKLSRGRYYIILKELLNIFLIIIPIIFIIYVLIQILSKGSI